MIVMTDYNLADISFFNSINDSASRSFVWNGTQAFIVPVANKTSDTEDFSRLKKFFRKAKKAVTQEPTIDPIKGSPSAADLRENSLKATKNRLKKAAVAMTLFPTLWMGSTGLESLASKTIMPDEYNRVVAEQSLGENLVDHLIWNDLYQICVHDKGWLRVLEWVRRAAEGGLGGNAVMELLVSYFDDKKNRKDSKSGKQHYSKKKSGTTAAEYNLAADLTDRFEQEKVLMQNSYTQKVMEMQKTIDRLQDQIVVLQKAGDLQRSSNF